MTGARDRVVAYAVGVTVAVGALAGVLARATVLVPLDWSDSTVEARVAQVLVVGSVLTVAALYVLVPVGVATVRAREDGRSLRHAGLAATAILGLPLAYLAVIVGVEAVGTPGRGLLLPLGVAALTAVLAGIVVAAALDRLPVVLPWVESAWPVALNVLVVVLFAVGFVGVQPFAGGFADSHTDTYGGYGGPHADFEVSVESVGDDRAVVTFTHAGGDPLPADHVVVRGEGFAAVDDVDHRGPGPWRGTVTGERPRRGGAAIVDGDSVSIGVTGECFVRLVVRVDEMRSTVAAYDCQEPR